VHQQCFNLLTHHSQGVGRGNGVGRGLGVGGGRVAVGVGVAVTVAVGVAVGVGVGVGVAPDKQTGTFVIWPLVILKLPVAVSKVGFDTE
jgi:hypothetical protein